MSLDALTLAAVADEWRTEVAGARIETIIQPSEYALALQCYVSGRQDRGGQNRWLYLSAHPQLARAHLTASKPPRIASDPPAFVMLLRKYLEGTRIEAIVQPRWERVLEVVTSYRRNAEGDERVRFHLIIEIMGRLSNIILCNDQREILGAVKYVVLEVNRYREIAVGRPYVPPPPQLRTVVGQSLPRLEPTSITAAQLVLCAADERAAQPVAPQEGKRKRAQGPATVWQMLSKHLLGCSPLLAREAVYRTSENAETVLECRDDAFWEELAWNVRELAGLYETHRWQPHIVEREGEEGPSGNAVGAQPALPLAFAAYPLEHYATLSGVRIRAASSMNDILDEYYARAEWSDAMGRVRAPIGKALQVHLERCKRKGEVLQHEMQRSQEAADYRMQAELLLAYQHEVPRGARSVVLQKFSENASGEASGEITVSLDPRFDAVGNANRLFQKYHKLRRATALLPAHIEQNAVEQATIEQLLSDLGLAETPAEVAFVKAEVQVAGYMRGKPVVSDKKGQKKSKKGNKQGKAAAPGGGVPLHLQSHDGFTLLVGKNSRQNEEVTFRQASSNDIWLHARGVPGAHVIIKSAGRTVPASTLDQAASLAAYYSQARGSTRVPVDYTLQRHVRHMKGGGPGMVIYEREKTLSVEPQETVSPSHR